MNEKCTVRKQWSITPVIKLRLTGLISKTRGRPWKTRQPEGRTSELKREEARSAKSDSTTSRYYCTYSTTVFRNQPCLKIVISDGEYPDNPDGTFNFPVCPTNLGNKYLLLLLVVLVQHRYSEFEDPVTILYCAMYPVHGDACQYRVRIKAETYYQQDQQVADSGIQYDVRSTIRFFAWSPA